ANNVEVRRIDLTGETADLRVPLANVIHLAGARNGGAFALTKHSVTRIAADGGIGPSLDVEAIGYGPPSAFAIDAHDDTVWVVTHGNLLIHVGAGGTVDAGATLNGEMQALDVALDRTVWTAGPGGVSRFSPAAQFLQPAHIPSSAGATQAIHI